MALTTYAVGAFAALSLVYYLYRLALPKPFPGIPYQQHAVKSIMGDLPEIKRKAQETGEPSMAMFSVARRLGTPICQLLLTSLVPPVVVLDDAREIEDILVRRNREFDRSPLTVDLFRQPFPHSTIAQYTTPGLKAQKRLWSDVMNADFLRRVVAPNIHLAAADLMELWRLKVARNGSTPFDAIEDFSSAALDAIWVAILGSKLDVVRNDIERFSPASEIREKTPEQIRRLQSATVIRESVEYANNAIDKGHPIETPFPAITFFFMSLSPRYRRFTKLRDAEIRRLMAEACERFQRSGGLGEDGDGEELDTCAMDLVLRREIVMAKKKGLPVPDPSRDPAMLQELLLLLLAGHDSTANTLCWFVKLMAGYQECQATLRRTLQAEFPMGVPDAANKIVDADIPYLDATVEELLRASGTTGIAARRALVDTEILGCRIPRGADVLLNLRVMYSPFEIPESRRSSSSQAAQAKRARGAFDGESGRNLDVYEPRRWLTMGPDGKEAFDAYSLPSLAFGGGPRGCFGKRLAIQELKITITHLILSFEFLPLPEELNSFDAKETIFRCPNMCHVRLRPL